MGSKLISVVIPTYNRKQRLQRVLGALERQSVDLRELEVVVVDDGSTDGTSEWLAAHHGPFQVRAITQKNGGPARARNAGLHAATGKYLVFLDDDVEPMPALLAEHLGSHQQPLLVVLGPLSSLPHYAQPWVAWEQAKLEDQYSAMTRGDWQPTFRQFWTGNASVEREHVLAEGGFNVEFLRGEDVELGYRLHLRGLSFVFNPRAQGFHHAERSLASWVHAHESYGRLEVQVFAHKGEEHLVMMLGENWRRLHPASRALISRCLDHPLRYQAATRALRGWLELADRSGRPLGTSKACSVLANLLYWQASAKELGPALTRRVLGSA
jgi:glycosyltransferase involved in cell wall biosynthesis